MAEFLAQADQQQGRLIGESPALNQPRDTLHPVHLQLGFAYLAQLEMDGVERIPRLVQRRALTYQATLLLVCLREEFCHYDLASPDATRLTKTRGQLQDMISAFVQET